MIGVTLEKLFRDADRNFWTWPYKLQLPFPDEFLMTVVPSSGKDFVNHSITGFPQHIKSAVIKFTGDN